MISQEYLAGLFDAEATIGIYITSNGCKTASGSKKYLHASSSMSGTYKPVYELLYNDINIGSLTARKQQLTIYNKDKPRSGKLQKQVWSWSFTSQKDITTLFNIVKPFSKEKLSQIETVLSFFNKEISAEEAALALDAAKKIEFPDISENHRSLSNETLPIEYIAGLFDGDGSIGIYSYTDKRYNTKNYSIKLAIYGSHKPVLDATVNTVNFGKVYSMKRKRGIYDPKGEFAPKCRQGWKFSLTSKADAKKFLNLIFPYLIEKKEQANIALK